MKIKYVHVYIRCKLLKIPGLAETEHNLPTRQKHDNVDDSDEISLVHIE